MAVRDPERRTSGNLTVDSVQGIWNVQLGVRQQNSARKGKASSYELFHIWNTTPSPRTPRWLDAVVQSNKLGFQCAITYLLLSPSDPSVTMPTTTSSTASSSMAAPTGNLPDGNVPAPAPLEVDVSDRALRYEKSERGLKSLRQVEV